MKNYDWGLLCCEPHKPIHKFSFHIVVGTGLRAYLSDWVINSFGIDLVLTKPSFEVLLVRTIQLGLHSFSSQLMYEIFNFKNILDDLVRRLISLISLHTFYEKKTIYIHFFCVFYREIANFPLIKIIIYQFSPYYFHKDQFPPCRYNSNRSCSIFKYFYLFAPIVQMTRDWRQFS